MKTVFKSKERLRRVLGVTTVVAVLGGGLWVWKSENHRPGSPRFAPAFELQDAKGQMHSLRALKDRPVILHFWASWCPPCIDEISAFVEAARALGGRGPQFVAVSLDKNWDEVFKLIPRDQWPKDVLSLLDPEGVVAERYGSFQFPETYALNPDHTVLRKWVGPQDWDLVVQALGSR